MVVGISPQFIFKEWIKPLSKKRWYIYLLCIDFCLLFTDYSFGEDNIFNAGSGKKAQPRFVYDDHGKRDPFLPLVDSNGFIITYEDNLLLTDLVLEGIILGGDDNTNLAIINGKVLKKGDKIGPFIVLNISAKSVLLGKGKRKFDLKLKKGE